MNKNHHHALIFGLITTFLMGLGFTIITPVVPFMVAPFATHRAQALIVTALTAIYALCTFVAAPALGALSDHFGRKPILLLSLAGSAIGYLIFGLAGSLSLLFVGRIIDGLTGGNIVTLFAYFADITIEENRTKVFGWTAASVGVGTISGPTVGGLLAHFGNGAPFLFGALISLANLLYGAFVMKESLTKQHRTSNFSITALNPFTQLFNLFKLKNLSRLLIAGILLWLPNGALQGIISQFSLDNFAWEPVFIGLAISIMGLMDILTQIFIMPKLLKIASENQLIKLAIACELIAYVLYTLSALTEIWPIFIIAMVIFGFGDSIFGTAFNGQLSKSASPSQQGQLQGGSQALQSLTRVAGPLIGGQLYTTLGSAAPMIFGFVLLLGALYLLKSKKIRLLAETL